jgi:hypothetical protein
VALAGCPLSRRDQAFAGLMASFGGGENACAVKVGGGTRDLARRGDARQHLLQRILGRRFLLRERDGGVASGSDAQAVGLDRRGGCYRCVVRALIDSLCYNESWLS